MGSRQRGRMSLLIRNLKFQTSPDRVREIFERFGAIRDVYLPLDYNTKRPRGFGFVEFHDERDTQAALEEMDQCDIDGNRIEVTLAQRGRSSPDSMRQREQPYRRFDRNRDYRDGGRSRRSRSPSRSRGRHGGRRRSPSWDRRGDRSLSPDRRRDRGGGHRRNDDYDRDDRRGRDLGRDRYRDDRHGGCFRRHSRSGSRREWRNDPYGNEERISHRNEQGRAENNEKMDSSSPIQCNSAGNSHGGGNDYRSAEDGGHTGDGGKVSVVNGGSGEVTSRGESRSRSPRC